MPPCHRMTAPTDAAQAAKASGDDRRQRLHDDRLGRRGRRAMGLTSVVRAPTSTPSSCGSHGPTPGTRTTSPHAPKSASSSSTRPFQRGSDKRCTSKPSRREVLEAERSRMLTVFSMRSTNRGAAAWTAADVTGDVPLTACTSLGPLPTSCSTTTIVVCASTSTSRTGADARRRSERGDHVFDRGSHGCAPVEVVDGGFVGVAFHRCRHAAEDATDAEHDRARSRRARSRRRA